MVLTTVVHKNAAGPWVATGDGSVAIEVLQVFWLPCQWRSCQVTLGAWLVFLQPL